MKYSNRLKRIACLALISTFYAGYAYSDVVITDFDTINPLNYGFSSWSSPVQFQSYIDGSNSGQEVLPISGGDPDVSGGAGRGGFSLDLTGITSLELSARLLASNEATTIQVSLLDSDGTLMRFYFPTSNYNTTTFNTGSKDFSSGTIGTVGGTPGLNVSAITGYQVQGNYYDPSGAANAKFNVQLDSVTAVIPEPSSLLLISIAGLSILGLRKRFSA